MKGLGDGGRADFIGSGGFAGSSSAKSNMTILNVDKPYLRGRILASLRTIDSHPRLLVFAGPIFAIREKDVPALPRI